MHFNHRTKLYIKLGNKPSYDKARFVREHMCNFEIHTVHGNLESCLIYECMLLIKTREEKAHIFSLQIHFLNLSGVVLYVIQLSLYCCDVLLSLYLI